MDAKALRRQIEDFLDEAVRIKPEDDRNGHEDLLLESGQLFSEQLLRFGSKQPEGNERVTASLVRDLRSATETVRSHRNGKER